MTLPTMQGKRIILATYGSPGDVQPFLAIGHALRRRGHAPVIATSEVYRGQVCAVGLEFTALRPNRQPGQQDPDFLDRLARGRESPEAIFRQMFLPSLRESAEDMLEIAAGADAVVSHTLVASGRLAAEVHGLPWISAVLQPMGYLSAYEPPLVGPPWLAAGLRAGGSSFTRRCFRAARLLTGRWAREWHAVRRELGLPDVTDHPLWEGQHSTLRSLGLFPRPLGEPRPDWPATARVTGFPFHHPPGRTLDDALRQFLEAGDPPLVFTLGTTAVHDPGRFYDESAAAAHHLGLRAVLVAGPGDLGKLNAWSRDILAVSYAPHDLLFPHALAVVHQAGIGTLSEAMRVGKPMLIMPYGHDQADNAWRARQLGVARIIARPRYERNAVRRALVALLDDAARSAASARIARTVAGEHGAETAAEYIEKVLA